MTLVSQQLSDQIYNIQHDMETAGNAIASAAQFVATRSSALVSYREGIPVSINPAQRVYESTAPYLADMENELKILKKAHKELSKIVKQLAKEIG